MSTDEAIRPKLQNVKLGDTKTTQIKQDITSIRNQVADIAQKATRAEKALARTFVEGTAAAVGIYKLTPTLAAFIFTHCNKFNREVSATKVANFVNDIGRGEWSFNHQGLGFYATGDLADGQHRTAATALSGKTFDYIIATGLSKTALDTVDRSVPWP